MATYLLTWNPGNWNWTSRNEDVEQIRKNGFTDYRWSTGNTKRITNGDRVFLLKQGKEPRGIIGAGYTLSQAPFYRAHWNDPEKEALYAKFRFEVLLAADEEPLLISKLNTGNLKDVEWSPQGSGTSVFPEAAAELEAVWREFLRQRGYSPFESADEIAGPERFIDGAGRQITVNAYERDPRARRACIEHFGAVCVVCDLDMAARYGNLGAGYIHVHHLLPLSEAGGRYEINPTKDLIPVCPNCHAMLHRRKPPFTVGELKKRLRP
jgi:5-methylcytosine-specific restriction protein A